LEWVIHIINFLLKGTQRESVSERLEHKVYERDGLGGTVKPRKSESQKPPKVELVHLLPPSFLDEFAKAENVSLITLSILDIKL